MKFQIKELQRRDGRRAISFAITGMHFDWYLSPGPLLRLYGRYFWYLELSRATQAFGAYADGWLAGVLLARFDGEPPRYRSPGRALFVRLFGALQRLAGGVRAYDRVNQEMLRDYRARHRPDSELLFLAADPDAQGRGAGTALLAELARRAPGRELYLFTDSGCTYRFYERRGFERAGEREITLELGAKRVPLTCFLYRKTL